jgi:hypothetical protein
MTEARELVRSTIGAVGTLAVVTVVAVLPAETGWDPTGVGALLGLTAMAPAPAAPEYRFRTDSLTVELAPGQGTEVKAVMRAGDQLVYTWTSDGDPVRYDFHGEPAGAPPEVFTSFAQGTSPRENGTFEAPFDGVHGWYWKNVGASRVSIHLETTGVYASIARK